MPITAFDVLIFAIILLSGFLAMVRGFTREALSFLAWVGAAFASLYGYTLILPFIERYIQSNLIASLVSMLIIFIIALIIASIISVRIADFIVSNRIGPLDRTIGFIFGLARGLLILVIAVLVLNLLVAPDRQYEWITASKTKPLLDSLANGLVNMLPEKFEDYLLIESKNIYQITPQLQTSFV